MLGVMLFLVIHRILIFLILVFSGAGGNFYLGFSYLGFLAIDYFTLLIVLMLGAWYGIWLGNYWFEKVYEERLHGGFVSLLASRLWPKRVSKLRQKMVSATEHLENDVWELEDLVKDLPPTASIKPVNVFKRRIVRKRPIKKI
jgi:hypothetical protein